MDDDDFGDVAFNPDAAIDDYDEYQQQIEEYIPEDTVIDEVSKSLHSEFASSSSSSSSANDTNSSSSSISVIQSKEIESREALSSVLSLPPAFLRKKNTDEVAQIFAMKLLAE
jgi:hypothetical protein